MKVAIVLNTSWNIYNFRMNFVKHLLGKGHEVHTIAPHDDFTHFLTEAGCVHHTITMDSRGINPFKDVALVAELWSIYRKVRPDVILHYTIKPNVYGSLAASMLGIPVINNVCGLGTVFLKKGFVSEIAKALYKWTFRYPKQVFFQNPDDRDLFISKGLVPKQTAALLPGSGIDLQYFTPSPYTRNSQFTFLLISRLITDKGIMEFVDAIEKLKERGVNARFQILGAKDPEHRRGIPLSVIDSWISKGTVEYLGTTRDVRPYIAAADCVVLPSYREGTPHTLLEAASCARPIIATDVPGCHHVVTDHYNGLLCKLKDADDLADKMAQMTGLQEDKLRQFGENGRRKMEKEFDEHIVINAYMDKLAELQQAS